MVCGCYPTTSFKRYLRDVISVKKTFKMCNLSAPNLTNTEDTCPHLNLFCYMFSLVLLLIPGIPESQKMFCFKVMNVTRDVRAAGYPCFSRTKTLCHTLPACIVKNRPIAKTILQRYTECFKPIGMCYLRNGRILY